MNPIEAVALSKFKLNGERAEVKPGSYNVNTTVSVKGTIKVGEDYEQQLVASADPWGLLAAALSKLNGVTVAALVREAENGGVDSAAVKTAAAAAIQAVKGPTLRTMSGKVTAKLIFA